MSDDATPRLINEPDFLVEGFHKLDDSVLEARAPRVTLLPKFHERSHEAQVAYLLKLASTMNHAAKLIQDERDAMVKLLEKKEEQLEKMAAAVAANNDMLQREVTRMNEQRQGYNEEVMRLGKQIRELEAHRHGSN